MARILNCLFTFCIVFFIFTSWLEAQEVIRGEVFDQSTREALIGANVVVVGTNTSTSTEWDGSFQLKVNQIPVTVEVSYTGYLTQTFEITDSKVKLKAGLEPNSYLIDPVIVVGSRISDKRRESPLTIESIDLLAIRESISNDFYEGLGALKGVDLTTASMGFTIINTRGFNSTSPVRSLQIIDGVDNQSPGLNFSLGNFLGCPELDVLKVELIEGASSAFFGPNAFNGVIDIQTKDPFLHPGFSAALKAGERNLLKGEFRYAKVFKSASGQDKFAFKINGAYMEADDWEATNIAPTSQSPTDETNPGGYDAVNIYGDEETSGPSFTGDIERIDYPGLKNFFRRGYAETDLVDYNTVNYKGNVGLFYKLNPRIQANGVFNFGSGTTVYQGENRFRLDDIFFWQGKIEVKQEKKFFLRAYITEEDAGKTYDAYATALRLQTAAKLNEDWAADYIQYWQTYNTQRVKKLEGYPTGFPFDYNQQEIVLAQNADLLRLWHAEAQAYANKKSPNKPNFAFFEPGTARFDSMFNIITSNFSNDPVNPGTRFYDKSGLIHVHGEYQFETPFANLTTGANFRQYNPDSRGTIFSDTLGKKITNHEFGVYAGLDKKLIPARLNLNATVRFDKNENFDMVVSPAASLVFTPDYNHIFRLSFSSAVRNPTLTDQYLNLDVGRAQLLGNISGYEDLITPASFIDYLNTRNRDTLVYFDEPAIQPEKVKSIEFGYRATLFEKLWLDAGYYFSWYKDFIGYKIGIQSDFNIFNYPVNTRVYRISANASSQVTTQGFNLGASYFIGSYYNLSGNYSWNVLNKKGTDDPIIPAFNTPEHKFNIGLSGRNIPISVFSNQLKNIGFNINYKWIEGFLFEGSPQFTGEIPTYDLVDAQVNWAAERLGLTIKLGATNVLDKKQFQTYGGPRIGRLAYISFLYEPKP
jgi:outer membrane receptor protein involved in Fe transport